MSVVVREVESASPSSTSPASFDEAAMSSGASGDSDGSAAERLTAVAAALGRLHDEVTDDVDRVDVVRALELVKAAAAAAQARLAVDLDVSQRALQAEAGVPATERGQGVAAQVALARRDSPHRGGRHLGLARALVREMPHTLAALEAGRISEWRATILVRETAVLTVEDRAAVDVEVAGDPARLRVLEQLGDRALAARVKQVAYRLDPRSVVERSRRAEDDRCVTIRPAPDTMAYLTALLPARDAIAAHVALGRAAEAARNAGDARGRGQLMADTLADSLIGLPTAGRGAGSGAPGAAGAASAGAGAGAAGAAAVGASGGWAAALAATTWDSPGPSTATGAVPSTAAPSTPRSRPGDVAVRLVMTDRALLDAGDEPAHLDGYGPVPAAWARDLVASTLGSSAADTRGVAGDESGDRGTGSAQVFVSRLLTDRNGAMVAMDSRSRTAPTGLAELIRIRDDGTCRTPWCDAPARHVDHVVPHAAGGPTAAHNLQGLCERCNHNKQALGWCATAHDPDLGTSGRPTTDGRTTGQDPPPDPAPGQAPDRHTVVITTPTGHSYVSIAPALPGTGHLVGLQADPPLAPDGPSSSGPCPDAGPDAGQERDSPVEDWLRAYLVAA